MTLRDGKFRDDKGNIVPIEHGNKEQIALINKFNEMSTDGFTPEIAVVKKVSMLFTCLCGTLNEFDDFIDLDVDDDVEQIAGSTDKCHCCGLEYRVIYESEWDGLMLKIVTKKK